MKQNKLERKKFLIKFAPTKEHYESGQHYTQIMYGVNQEHIRKLFYDKPEFTQFYIGKIEQLFDND